MENLFLGSPLFQQGSLFPIGRKRRSPQISDMDQKNLDSWQPEVNYQQPEVNYQQAAVSDQKLLEQFRKR